MHVFAQGAKFPWKSLWKQMPRKVSPGTVQWLIIPVAWGTFQAGSLCRSEAGAWRLVCQARICLHFLPPAYWIKACTLFLLAQCINSVLHKAGRGPASKARGMQLIRKWKQNSESWQHKEQGKIRKQAGSSWVYRNVCSWERSCGMSQHLYRLYPKSFCDTASATQHLPLHRQSERSPRRLPCSRIYQPKAALTRAKVRLGPQGNTCSCYGNGALAAVTSSQGACAPAALSSRYRTKCPAAGIAPLGTQGLALLLRHAKEKPQRQMLNTGADL